MIDEALPRHRLPAANPGDASTTVLVGIKRQDWAAQSEAALKLGRKLAGRGEIAYCVVSDGRCSSADKTADLRVHSRKRSRLRSAKLLDESYRFLCEGRICDRSRHGLRLALARDLTLPSRLAVHIDETAEVCQAKIVWRRGSTVGVRLQRALPEDALTASRRSALRERYYGIPD
jgi:PilZ domain